MSKVRVEGLSAINNVLRQLPKGTGKATLVRVGKKRLEPMRDAARANAPVGDEPANEKHVRLSANIEISTRQSSAREKEATRRQRRFADKSAVEVYMGPISHKGLGHAIPQEFGSIHNRPTGYMRRAWDEHHEELLTDIAKDLGDAVDASAKRHARKMARKQARGSR